MFGIFVDDIHVDETQFIMGPLRGDEMSLHMSVIPVGSVVDQLRLTYGFKSCRIRRNCSVRF